MLRKKGPNVNNLTKGIDRQSFNNIRKHVNQKYGINLSLSKKNLVENRLFKRLRHYNFESYSEYHDFIFSQKGRNELALLSDYLSTNKTYFYREHAHFEFFNAFMERFDRHKTLSIWSAASSTGDEAYTLSILLNEFNDRNPHQRIRYSILGTDISSSVLQIANEGVYKKSHLESLPQALFSKYFKKMTSENGSESYRLIDRVRHYVQFKKLNLINDIPSVIQKFDIIFCRNVLIYFDDENKTKVNKQLINSLKPGGYLVLGHCEGFICKSDKVKQVQPAVFQKL